MNGDPTVPASKQENHRPGQQRNDVALLRQVPPAEESAEGYGGASG